MKAIEFENEKRRLEQVKPKKRQRLKQEDITIELLEECSLIMAIVIERYGDFYLPFFIKIQEEIGHIKHHKSYKEIALQILKDRT